MSESEMKKNKTKKKENYYLKSYYSYEHDCVKSLSLNLYFIL